MARLIRLLPDHRESVLAQRVYLKSRWYDSWSIYPDLWANYAEWSCAPSMPVAEIEWRYGLGLANGGGQFENVFRREGTNRLYVKIEYDTHSLPLGQGGETVAWYGTCEVTQDAQHGALKRDTWKATGKQFFTCYGLDLLLQQTEVVRDKVRTYNGVGWTKCGLTYNHEGRANRTSNQQFGSYVFEGMPDSSPKYWSTYSIVDYLLRNHRPTDANGAEWIPFYLLDNDNVLPTWDQPTIESHRVSVRDLLNQLINRNRLLSYKLQVTDAGIAVIPFSFTDVPIVLQSPTGAQTGYNPNTIQIAAERDTGATVVVKSSTLDSVDQVRAEGARKTTTATFSFFDSSLEIGWKNTDETDYEAGGSSDPDYPAAGDIELRAQFIINFRARENMKDVFSRFVLPSNWVGIVKNGLNEGGQKLTFPDVDNPAVNVPLALEHRRFLNHLELREGVDYESIVGVTFQQAEQENQRRKPLVMFPLPLEEGETRPATKSDWKWTQADTASLSANLETVGFPFSVRASVGHDGALNVEVLNGYQEWIAHGDFTPIDGIDEVLPVECTFREMLATLSIEWSEFASATFPATAATSRDVARRLVIDCGESYRMDYITEGTVIGLSPDGTLQTADCNGSPGLYFRDDSDKLAGIAEMAYQWYSRERHAVDITTTLITSAVSVGDYVTAIGDWDLAGDTITDNINSVVSAIRIESRGTETTADAGVVPQVPRMSITTAFGELDPLRMLSRRRAR